MCSPLLGVPGGSLVGQPQCLKRTDLCHFSTTIYWSNICIPAYVKTVFYMTLCFIIHSLINPSISIVKMLLEVRALLQHHCSSPHLRFCYSGHITVTYFFFYYLVKKLIPLFLTFILQQLVVYQCVYPVKIKSSLPCQ